MLEKITGMTLEANYLDFMLPNSICKNCELSLSLAFQFRMKAIKSQQIISIFCKHKLEKGDESIKKEINDEFSEFHETFNEDYILEEHLLNVDNDNDRKLKVEELEISFLDNTRDRNTEKIEYLDESFIQLNEEMEMNYSSDDEQNSCTNSQNINETQCESPTTSILADSEKNFENEIQIDKKRRTKRKPSSKVKELNVAKRSKRVPKPKLYKECITDINEESVDGTDARDDPLNRSTDTSSDHEGQIKSITNENRYICDICGNIYAKRGRMMEHRRRHNKELNYDCELCEESFHLRELLRKHMFSHSGGKPYKCTYCSRTFFYKSVQSAHEAVHKGHRPFVCEVCDKSFAYAHALKKHKLIHAEIKLYHCDYCDKDFRLQHHMKQHEITRTHKNAVKYAEEKRLILEEG